MKLFSIILLFTFCSFTGINAQAVVQNDYYLDGKIKSEISYSDSLRDGIAKFYHENGNLKEERNYINGRVEGTIKQYYYNGKLKEIFTLIDGKREGPVSQFDSNGVYLKDITFTDGTQNADEGNTETETKITTDSIFAAKIEDLKKKSTKTPLPPDFTQAVRKDDPVFFITLDKIPKPIGGMAVIYKKLVYPEEARANKIKGTVEIIAFIDEVGMVQDTKVLKRIGYGCDESAQTAIKYTRFEPGELNGNPVKSQLKISVEFKSYNE